MVELAKIRMMHDVPVLAGARLSHLGLFHPIGRSGGVPSGEVEGGIGSQDRDEDRQRDEAIVVGGCQLYAYRRRRMFSLLAAAKVNAGVFGPFGTAHRCPVFCFQL